MAKRTISSPRGAAVYDKETGITIRMDHREAELLLPGYEPVNDFECPEVVHAEVTSKCNLDCPYCYVPREEKELSTREWVRMIENLCDFGIFQLTIGGGEPFLRKDVCKLARFADDCGLNVTATTNGVLLDSFSTGDLSVFRQINISYHRASVDRGFRIEDGLSRLTRANIPAGINLVMSREYAPAMPYLASLAKENDAVLLLLSYKPIQGDRENCIDLKTIEEQARTLAKEGLTVGIDSLTCGDCTMNERMCVISTSGEVFPCSFVRRRMGNVLDEGIEDIWRSRGGKIDCPHMEDLPDGMA